MGERFPFDIPTVESVMERFWEGHKERSELPYQVEEFDMTSDGARRVTFKGNTITLVHIAGANAILNLRIQKSGNPIIPMRSLMTITHDYEEVFFQWNAVAAGLAIVVLGIDLSLG